MKFFKENKFAVSIIALAVFLIIASLVVRLRGPEKINNDTKLVNNFNGVFIPSFNDVRGVVERGSEKWVAAQVAVRIKDNKITFFTQKDGIAANNTTGVYNFDNQIWFTSQGGISRYIDSDNSFKTYLIGEANISLIEDPYTKKLYASTFENFFIYNKDFDKWTRSESGNVPINVGKNMVFTANNIIASSYPSALPAVVYNKSSDQWSRTDIAEFGSQQELKLFNVDERVFIYGRSKNYTSCGEFGKEPSSIYLEFKDGKWVPVEILNKTFYNFEPIISTVESSKNSIVFYALKDDCSGSGVSKGYEKTVVNFSDNGVDIDSQNDVLVWNRDSDYADIIKQISRLSGLMPKHEILSFEDGIMLSKTTDFDKSVSLTKITLTDSSYKEKTIIDSKDFGSINILDLVKCSNKSSFVIAANVSEYDGSGENYQIYKLENDDASKINTDVSSLPIDNLNSLVCSNSEMYWVGNENINKVIIAGDKIDEAIVKSLKDLNIKRARYELSKDGKLWFSDSDDASKIYSFDFLSQEVAKYNKPLSDSTLELLDVENGSFWFKQYDNPDSQIVVVDLSGAIKKTYGILGSIVGFVGLGDNKYLVSTDGQLLILDDMDTKTRLLNSSALLPFYDKPTTFMGELSVFNFVKNKDQMLFESVNYGDAGSFILSLSDILK